MSVSEVPASLNRFAHKHVSVIWKFGFLMILLLIFGIESLYEKRRGSIDLIVYAYSTQIEVFSERIFPEFERTWEAAHNKDLAITAHFGPSLTLAGQIVLGEPADVAILSHEQHVNYLKLGKMVHEDSRPVAIHNTPMVIVTRPGNPKGIQEFTDLSRSGIQLIHTDPRSSGAGAWAILAEYGCSLEQLEDEAEAIEQLSEIWSNVNILASSARSAMAIFECGAGDALITYEQEARMALARREKLTIVIPSCTVVAEPMAVIVDKNVSSEERTVAEEFLQYLLSEDVQKYFIEYQLRPVAWIENTFPALDQRISVADFGGLAQVYRELIDELWMEEIEPDLDLQVEVNPYETNRD